MCAIIIGYEKIPIVKGDFMKKIISIISGVLLMTPLLSSFKASALNFPLKSQIQSESAVVINLDTNTVIHEKNADVQQMPGPLVNIMTAVVCLENCQNLDEKVTINSAIYSGLENIQYPEDLRYADIKDGDVLTVSDLLHAMMLTSSVEASQTIASYIGNGNVGDFVDKMNSKASEIGLNATNFTNPTGMYDSNQYTTAHDMATLTQYALSVPLFENIATKQKYNSSVPNFANHPSNKDWVWVNSNLMMDESDEKYYYAGAKGIKTANLAAAGRNCISMASRDGNRYIAVLLKSPLKDDEGNNKYYHLEDTKSVFDWAFSHFSYRVILSDSAEKDEVPVTLADGKNYVLARPAKEVSMLWYDEVDTSLIKSDGENIKFDKASFRAPVKKGQRLGEVTLTYSGEILGTVELVAVNDVARSSSKYNIFAAKNFSKSEWFKKAIMISSILAAIYILVCIYSYICFKSNAKRVKSVYAMPKVPKKKRKKKTNKTE